MDVNVILLPGRSNPREERPLPADKETGCLTSCLLVLVSTNFFDVLLNVHLSRIPCTGRLPTGVMIPDAV